MERPEEFPLITGRLSLDLVNTEAVRWGKRIDLLVTPKDLQRWVQAVEHAGGLSRASLPVGSCSDEALASLISLRALLREGFEAVAGGEKLDESWAQRLEQWLENAPLAYKVVAGSLVPVPQGAPKDAIASLTALDALKLLASGELSTVRRCANPDCVLMFVDASGRRKWCSMKLCGNRMKVARHHARRSAAQDH